MSRISVETQLVLTFTSRFLAALLFKNANSTAIVSMLEREEASVSRAKSADSCAAGPAEIPGSGVSSKSAAIGLLQAL